MAVITREGAFQDWITVSGFAGIPNDRSVKLLDEHPDGDHVALQAWDQKEWAGVWRRTTGELVWRGPDAVLAAWMPGGDQLGMVRYVFDPSIGRPAIIATRTQREMHDYWEREEWPSGQHVALAPIAFPTGWPADLAISPRGDLAAIRWQEQDCSGVVLVELGDDSDRQVPDAGYRSSTHLVQRPVFSLDGRSVVITCTWPSFWHPGNGELPAEVDHAEIGYVAVLDCDDPTRAARQIPVAADLPAGFLPSGNDIEGEEMMSGAVFDSPTEFSVRLPTAEVRQFSLLSRGQNQGSSWSIAGPSRS